MLKFHQTVLANGLTIIGEERASAVSSAVGFFVRAGSRDETPEVSGVSHFLEHMMFKGTEKRSALDINYALGRIGAQANAFTSEEATVYYMAVLPEYLHDGFELLSDMLRPALDPKEFDTEKNVILDEIALYKDRPTYVLYEGAVKAFFANHPRGNSVLGTTESISALKRDQMKDYFDSRYTAANITLAVSGQFEWDKVIEWANHYCGKWSNKSVDRKLSIPSEHKEYLEIAKKDLQCAHLCLLSPGPAIGNDLRYPVQVLSCILGDSSGSKTYWKLVDKGLAESAYIDSDEMEDGGMITGYVSGDPQQIDQLAEILSEIMKKPTDFNEEELNRAKTKLRSRLVLQSESSMRRLMGIGLEWLYLRRYSSIAQELLRLQAVTTSNIYQALEQFSFDPVTKVKLFPQ